MERFAIKIDERVKLNLYNICRLCGIDNRDQVPIVDDPDGTFTIEDEPSLCKKIVDCVGIQVTSTDKMPQKICVLCVDKINDFYEYREMCKATNLQTRELLGLPPEVVKDEKPPLREDRPPTPQQPLMELTPTGTAMKRKRKLKSECISYEELDDDEIDEKPPKKKISKHSVGAKKKFSPARKIVVKRESVKTLPPRVLPNREKAIPVLKPATINKEKLLAPPVKDKAIALREKSIPVKEKPVIKEKAMTVKEKQTLLKEKTQTIKAKIATPPIKENRLVTREKLQSTKEKSIPPIKEKPQKAIVEKEKVKPVREKLLINSKLPVLNLKQNKEKGVIKEKLNLSVEDKKNEPTSSKIDTDLVTLKTPNRRERQRELETKKKRKVHVLPPVETVKTENLVACIVCPKDFKTQPEYDLHFFREHTPNTLEHGCSACREAFYDLQEYRDHQLWHRLSSIAFSCFKCNSQFDRITGYTRHFLTSCVPPIEYDIVDDIKCPKCQKTFVTKNLYEWHGCLIKNNSKCPRCNKFFAKKLLLQRHVVICAGKKAVPDPVTAPAPAAKSNKNTESVETENTLISTPTDTAIKIVKVEPEPVVETEEETQVSVSNKENDDEDGEVENSVVDDIGFQDEDDEAEEDTTANDSSVIDEPATVPNVNDDDVIVISDNEERVNTVLPVKQEKVDRRYEEVISRASANIPMVQIKQEVLSSDYTANNVDLTVLRNIKPEPAEAVSEPAVSSLPITTVSESSKSTDAAPIAAAVPESTNQSSKLVAAAKPTLKLKIRKEHGTLNSSFIEPGENEEDSSSPNRSQSNDDEASNNPHRKRRNKHKKKIYKIPKQLALIIKQEKQNRTESAEPVVIAAEPRITVPVISEVTSIAATGLDSTNKVTHSDCFAYEEGSSMSNSFPYDSRETSANTNPAVPETGIQIPVIAEVVSLKQTESSVPLISSVTSLSQSSGIRVKMEFNNFLSPTSEEPTIIVNPIEQDDMITGNYHMEYDENPDNDFEHTDSEEVPLSTSKDTIESEIDEKPNLSELMKMSAVGQVSSSAPVTIGNVAIKLEKSPHNTDLSMEREPTVLRVKTIDSLKNVLQDEVRRERLIEINAEKTRKNRLTTATAPQNSGCDATGNLGTKNQSFDDSVKIKLEPSDIEELPTTDPVDVSDELQGSEMDSPSNEEQDKGETSRIETGSTDVPLDPVLDISIKVELSTNDGHFNEQENEANVSTDNTEQDILPATEAETSCLPSKSKAIETDFEISTSHNFNDTCTEFPTSEAMQVSTIDAAKAIKICDITQNIKMELSTADTDTGDIEMEITVDTPVIVKEETTFVESLGIGSMTTQMDVTMEDSGSVETDTDMHVELQATENNVPINNQDNGENHNAVLPTFETGDNVNNDAFKVSEIVLETGSTDGDIIEVQANKTELNFISPDNVETGVARLPIEMGRDCHPPEVCEPSETNISIGSIDSTENISAIMSTTEAETSGGDGVIVDLNVHQTDPPVDITNNSEHDEMQDPISGASNDSVTAEVCDARESDVPIGSPDNEANNETVCVYAKVCDAIETNPNSPDNMENGNATIPETVTSGDGSNVEIKVTQTDLPIGSKDNFENDEANLSTSETSVDGSNVEVATIPATDNSICDSNVKVLSNTDLAIDSTDHLVENYEVELSASGTNDDRVNAEVYDACESNQSINSPNNVVKDEAGIPTIEISEGSFNVEICNVPETNMSIVPENIENVITTVLTAETTCGSQDNLEMEVSSNFATDATIPTVEPARASGTDNLECSLDVSSNSDVNDVASDTCEKEFPIDNQDHENDTSLWNTETVVNPEFKANQSDFVGSTDNNKTSELDGAVVSEFKANEPDLFVGIPDNKENAATIPTTETDVSIVEFKISEIHIPSISDSEDIKTDSTEFQTTETELVLSAQISVPVVPMKRPLETDDETEEPNAKIKKLSDCHLEITKHLELHDNEGILASGLDTSDVGVISEMEENTQGDTTPIETELNVEYNENLDTTEIVGNNQIVENFIPGVPEEENTMEQPFVIEHQINEEQDTIRPNQYDANVIAENSSASENYAIQTNEDFHQRTYDNDKCDINMGEQSDFEHVDVQLKHQSEIPQENSFIIQQEEFVSSTQHNNESLNNVNDINMETEESNIEHNPESNIYQDPIQNTVHEVCTNEDITMQSHEEVCNMDVSDVIHNVIIQPEQAVGEQISIQIEKETDNSMIISEQVVSAHEPTSPNISEPIVEERPANEELVYNVNVISEETSLTIEAVAQENRISEIIDIELISKEQEEISKNPVNEDLSQERLDTVKETDVLNCGSTGVIDENMSDVHENVALQCNNTSEGITQSNVEEYEQCSALIEPMIELNENSSGSPKEENDFDGANNLESYADDVPENVCIATFESDQPLGELRHPGDTFCTPELIETPLIAEIQPIMEEVNPCLDLSQVINVSSQEHNSDLLLEDERTPQEENMDDDNTSTTISDSDTPLEDLTKSDENFYEADSIVDNTETDSDERLESSLDKMQRSTDEIIDLDEISDESSQSAMDQDDSSEIQPEAVQTTTDDPVNYLIEISDDSSENSMERSPNTALNMADNIGPSQEDSSTSKLDTEESSDATQCENINIILDTICDTSSESPKPETNSKDNTESSFAIGSSSNAHEISRVPPAADGSSQSTNPETNKNAAEFMRPAVMSTHEVPSCESTDIISVSSQIQHEDAEIPVNPAMEYQSTIGSHVETVVENVSSHLDVATMHENLNVNLDGATGSSLATVSKAKGNDDIDSDLEKELLEEVQ